ncbi:hypothetical protein [Burkholderia sp.]|uniref:hypothetical protein n=1 Tax=Burkholderia sp. TaxID=36773 RepID=UPI0025BE6447|nr:hypothetical protein [Burkholderia sp.]MBS6363412.1 hypothetical protein [Burkholderia sp.]
MSQFITPQMLLSGETTFEAAHRIDLIRTERRRLRSGLDKLAERARLTSYWRQCYPVWQPELSRINPHFALVHLRSFKPGMHFGHLSLLPGHVPPHLAGRQRLRAGFGRVTERRPQDEIAESGAAAPAQGELF